MIDVNPKKCPDTFYYCLDCHKRFVKIDGKMFNLNITSGTFGYDFDIISENSFVNENEISLNVHCNSNGKLETVLEKESRLINESIAEWISNNKYIKYHPYKLEDKKWIILGEISGILISERSKGDNHAKINFLSEDDGNWFLSENHGMSSFWFEDYLKLIEKANDFLNTDNFVKREYGFYFN